VRVAPLAAAATGHDRAAHAELAASAPGALAAEDAECGHLAYGNEERNMSRKLASPLRLFVAVLAAPALCLLLHSDAAAQRPRRELALS